MFGLLDTRILYRVCTENLLCKFGAHAEDKNINVFNGQSEYVIPDRSTGDDCVSPGLACHLATEIFPFARNGSQNGRTRRVGFDNVHISAAPNVYKMGLF